MQLFWAKQYRKLQHSAVINTYFKYWVQHHTSIHHLSKYSIALLQFQCLKRMQINVFKSFPPYLLFAKLFPKCLSVSWTQISTDRQPDGRTNTVWQVEQNRLTNHRSRYQIQDWKYKDMQFSGYKVCHLRVHRVTSSALENITIYSNILLLILRKKWNTSIQKYDVRVSHAKPYNNLNYL